MKKLALLIILPLVSLPCLRAEVDKTPTQVEIVSVLSGFDLDSARKVKSTTTKGAAPVQLPKVTTKDGKAAVIKIVREFPHPVDFDAKSTRTTFDTANLGVVLSVKPYIVNGEINFFGNLLLTALPENADPKPKLDAIPAILSSKKIFSGKAKNGEKIEINTLSPLGEKTILYIAFMLMNNEGMPVE